MVDELPFINYSNSKHVDRSTLSRIRSHAQQKVQDEKWSKKIGRERDGGTKVVVPRVPERQCLKLVFEKRSKKGESSVKKAKRKQLEEVKREVATKLCQTLAVTPVHKQDPFDSFPVTLNAELVDLLQSYYGSWKWANTKSSIFHETMSNPVLIHSCLAMAYHICRQDEVRTIEHESKTMELVASGINNIGNVRGDQRRDQACALIWAMIRLATIKVNQGQLDTSLNHLNALVLVSPTLKDFEGHKFALHLQSATASLFLANYTQSGKVLPLLHAPFGPIRTSALLDVKAQGYTVPDGAVLLDPVVKCLIDPAVLDHILALTALFNLSKKIEDGTEQSIPHTHTGRQAFEGVRIALRLAQLVPQAREGNAAWHSDFQNCLRQTAVIFTWTFARRVDSKWEAISSVQNQLRELVNMHFLSAVLSRGRGNPSLADLVLWILVVCGSTTTHHDHRAYYAELIHSCFPERKSQPYEEMKKIGQVLPWIDVQDNAPAEEFWSIVTADSLRGMKSEDNEHHSGPLLVGFVRHRSDSQKS